MGEKVLRMVVGLFVGIWVARYLGPEQFGLLSYAQSFVFLFTAIATLGLDGIVVRELVKHPEKRSSLLGTAFGLKLIGAIMVLPVLAIAVQLTNNDHYTNVLVFIIASASIFQCFNVIDFYYQATVQSKYVALANTITLAISSVIKIGLILNEAPLIAFAAMVLFDSVVLGFGLIYFYLKQIRLKTLNFKFSRTMAGELLKDSWPLILSGLVISVYMKIDQVMIKEMIGVEAVGQYAAAVRISETWYFIPMVISGSLFPAIVKYKKISIELFYERFQSFLDLMFYTGLCMAIPIAIFSKNIVEILYGPVYLQASSVLALHALGGIFVAISVAQGKYWLTFNLQNKLVWITSFCALTNVLLNLILIPLYGISGAAGATVVSYFFGSMIYPFFIVESRKMLYQSFLVLNFIRVFGCLIKKL